MYYIFLSSKYWFFVPRIYLSYSTCQQFAFSINYCIFLIIRQFQFRHKHNKLEN